MVQMLDFFVGLLPKLVAWLSGRLIAPGVSLMGFFAALFIICLLLNNFLLRGH